MLVAGALLYANLRSHIVYDKLGYWYCGRGFPIYFQWHSLWDEHGDAFMQFGGMASWEPAGILVDALLAGGVLGMTGLVSERLLRKRKREP